MLQLAAEAFQAKNFDLAADIYECQLSGGHAGPASRLELLVRRADALVCGGKLPEALEVYRRASEIERLTPAHLGRLLDYLSGSIRRRDGSADRCPRQEAGAAAGGTQDFSCGVCLGFLLEPVTLPCGHSFCKKCLDRERSPVVCRQCRASSKVADVEGYRVNVVLSSLLAKWFPGPHQAGQLRREGNGLYAEKRTEAALDKYNQAILIGTLITSLHGEE